MRGKKIQKKGTKRMFKNEIKNKGFNLFLLALSALFIVTTALNFSVWF